MAKATIMQHVRTIDYLISKNDDYYFCSMLNRALQLFVIYDNERKPFLGVMFEIEKRDAEILHYFNQSKTYMAINFYEYDPLLYAISEHHFDARMHFSFLKSNAKSIKLEMIYTKKGHSGKGIATNMLAVLDNIAINKNIKQISGKFEPFNYCQNLPERLEKFYTLSNYKILAKNKSEPAVQSGDKLLHSLTKPVAHQIKQKAMLIPAPKHDYTVIMPSKHIEHSGYSDNYIIK